MSHRTVPIALLSLTATLWPCLAGAWPCPAPQDYDDNELEVHSFRPTKEIQPQPALGAGAGTCQSTGFALKSWCADNLAMWPSTGLDLDGPMVLWLPGQGSAPADHEVMLKAAAFAGFRTLGLAFDNYLFTRREWCDDGPGLYGGSCDSADGCLFPTGFAMVDGTPNPGFAYEPGRLRSIKGRLSLALHDLYLHDLLDGSNDEQWDDFCSYSPQDGTQLHYDDMIVSGFSSGGQTATFISYTREVAGLFTVEAGADFCEADAWPIPTDVGYPEEYDQHVAHPPCADPVGHCDPDERLVALHEGGQIFPMLPLLEDNLVQVGIDLVEYNVDSELDQGMMPAFASNLWTTSEYAAKAGCNQHKSMAIDTCLMHENGTATWAEGCDPVDEVYLFPAHLQAFCEVAP